MQELQASGVSASDALRELQDKLETTNRILESYDPVNGIVKMVGEAWISDGRNEVRGDRITYDLNKEQITAEGDASGQVRMKITPPEEDDEESSGEDSSQ